MTDQDAPAAFPGLDTLTEVLPQVVTLGTVELKRYLSKSRQLAWSREPEALVTLEKIGEALRSVKIQSGWSIPQVLHVIGCEQRRATLNTDHLSVALRHMRRLAAGVHDVSEIVEEQSVVDLSFRSPAGDPEGDLRTMANESWTNIYLEARSFAAQYAFNDGAPVVADSDVRAKLMAGRRRYAS